MPAAEGPRLTKVSAICLALPEAARTVRGSHAAFTVRKKKFAYFLNDHHGDGIVSICARAFPGENKALVAAHPRKFYLPAYVGPLGWYFRPPSRSRQARLERSAGLGHRQLSAGRAQKAGRHTRGRNLLTPDNSEVFDSDPI